MKIDPKILAACSAKAEEAQFLYDWLIDSKDPVTNKTWTADDNKVAMDLLNNLKPSPPLTLGGYLKSSTRNGAYGVGGICAVGGAIFGGLLTAVSGPFAVLGATAGGALAGFIGGAIVGAPLGALTGLLTYPIAERMRKNTISVQENAIQELQKFGREQYAAATKERELTSTASPTQQSELSQSAKLLSSLQVDLKNPQPTMNKTVETKSAVTATATTNTPTRPVIAATPSAPSNDDKPTTPGFRR